MHGITSRAYEPLTTTIPSCTWSNKELHGPVTDHRPCGSQLHHTFSGTSLQSYAVTNSLDHKITAAFGFHRFLCAGQFTTPTDSTFNPTIHMSFGNVSWHLTQHLTQPEAQKIKNWPGWQRHNCPLTQNCWCILPYSSMLWYWRDITAPSPARTPLFQLTDGHPLSTV